MAGPKRKGKKKPEASQPQPEPEPQQEQLEDNLEDFMDVGGSPVPGLTLRRILAGHTGAIFRIVWSPDGKRLASPSIDKHTRIWDVERGECVAVLDGDGNNISAAWSPDGHRLVTGYADKAVQVWDCNTWKTLAVLKEPESIDTYASDLSSAAWSPDGNSLALLYYHGAIQLWDTNTYSLKQTLIFKTDRATSIVWSPNGDTIAVTTGNIIQLYDVRSSKAKLIKSLKSHTGWVFSASWLLDGNLLASSSLDKTIRLWDVISYQSIQVLEGHIDPVKCLSLSANGVLLASKAKDGIRLWRTDTWETVAVLEETAVDRWPPGLAFHPYLPRLATLGKEDTIIRIWDLDMDVLLGGQTATESVRYTTAKLVLVGDSGVGKTGLGWRLAHGEFKEHPSTHGQQFWVINELSTKRKDNTECEAVLWDLAGQHVYRSIHAIFLDDVDLSLVLFDPTNRQEPLKGAQFWLEQLSGKQQLPPTVLVGARADRGSAVLSQQELEQFCEHYGISGGYLNTSAQSGEGVNQLLEIIKSQIPWEQMTTTVTTVTFKRIKEYVLALKEKPDRKGVLAHPPELRQQLQATTPDWQFTDADMMTAVKHLETHGYAAILRSSSGEQSILLTPELLVDLASSIVLQAAKHPRELGALSETALLQGNYPFPELANLEQAEQQVLLDAAIARFLSHNICFRETLGTEALLIFPGLIKQKRPLLDDVETVEDMSYIVRGRVENVYAALVVLIGYTPSFTRINQWQNQVQYEMGKGEICGFRLIEEREGEIELVLYYSTAMPDYGRMMFEGLFEKFLFQRDVEVTRFPPVVCPNTHRQERATVVKRLREGKKFVFCEECGAKINLPDIEKPLAFGARDSRWIQREERLARLRSLYETHLVRIKGFRRDRVAPRCYISHMPEQASWVSQLEHDLRDAGVFVLENRAQIQANDFILMVGATAYKRAWDRSAEPIAADASLIRARLQQGATQWPTVVPLLLEGDPDAALPRELRGCHIGDFHNQTLYALKLFDLVMTLYAIQLDHPAFEPLRHGLLRQWEDTLSRIDEDEIAKAKSPALKIFISYSHKDERFKEELITMLEGMQRKGIIEAWQDRRIEEGDEWLQSIQIAMNECDLALLLVSKNFLASRFIRDKELPHLLQRRKEEGLRIVPIIISPCLWKSEPLLSDLQALPKEGKPVIKFPKHTGARDPGLGRDCSGY